MCRNTTPITPICERRHEAKSGDNMGGSLPSGIADSVGVPVKPSHGRSGAVHPSMI